MTTATYTVTLNDPSTADVTVLVSTTSLHVELRDGETASWGKVVRVVIPSGTVGGIGISDVTVQALNLDIANGGIHSVRISHQCDTDDPLFANITGTGWLHIKDNDVAEVFIFPDELEVPEQTENEWLNGVEGISGVVVTAEVSLLSFPEEGDLVTVTLTSSDGTALKLGSLESCASGGTERGDLAISCMSSSAFVTFSLENRGSKEISLYAPYDNVAQASRSFILVATIVSSSPTFNALPDARIRTVVTDEDAVGLYTSVESRSINSYKEPFLVKEGAGKPIELSAFLLSRPTEEVKCTIAETYISGAVHPDLSIKQFDVRPTEVSFLPTTFAKPSTISLNGVKDGLADGDVSVSLEYVCSSVDDKYNSTFIISAVFTAIDTDASGIRVINSDGAALEAGSSVTIEEGASASISIRFLSRPYCDACQIGLQVAINASEGPVVPSVSSFDIIPAAWGQLLKLDLFVPEDSFATGDLLQAITLSLDTTDVIYGALGSTTVEVLVKDNDVPALEWRPASMTLYEGRVPTALDVRLTSRPIDGSVTITLADTGAGGASAHGLVVSPAAVTFGGSGGPWDEWQSFDLSKVQDDLQTGTQTADICLEVDSEDSAFGLLPKSDPARCTQVSFVDDELAEPVTTLVEPSDVESVEVTLSGGGLVSTGVSIPPGGLSSRVLITLAELAPYEVAATVEPTGFDEVSKMTAFTPHGTPCRGCKIRIATIGSTVKNLVLLRADDEASPGFNPVTDGVSFYFVEGTSPSDRVLVGEAVVQSFSVYLVSEMRPQVTVDAGAEALALHSEDVEASPLFPALELTVEKAVLGAYELFEVSVSIARAAAADENGPGALGDALNATGELPDDATAPAAEKYDNTPDELAIDCAYAGNAANASSNNTGGLDIAECTGACAECEAALELFEGGGSSQNLMWDAESQVLMLRPSPDAESSSTQVALAASTYLAALKGVVFKNPSNNPDPAARRRVTLGLVENHLGSNIKLDRPQALTFNFGIEAVNDPPEVVLSTSLLTYKEGSGAARIDPLIVVGDPDSTAFASCTVWISPKVDGEALALTQQSDMEVDVTWSVSTVERPGDAIFLSSSSSFMTRADLQTALRSVTFLSDIKRHETLERNISIVVNDGVASSDIAVLFIDIVAKNDAPFFLTDLFNSFSTNEDTVMKFTSGVRDPEYALTTTEVVCQGQLGSIVPVKRYCVPAGCENTTGECETCYFDFEYKPNKDMHGRDTFVIQASDGEALSPMQAFEMTVLPLNDPPKVNNYTFWVNVGEERSGTSIHLQGSDPDDVPVAYYQIWDEDRDWVLSDITFIRLPPVEGYETLVEGRPRGGPEITFYVSPSANPPSEERFAYRGFDELGTMSNIGYVSVNVRNPKQSSDPPIALDETITAPEGQLFRGTFKFDHPLGRFGVSPTFSIVQCPRLGALWIEDDGAAGEYIYRPHPFISADENTVDEFTFQVRLAGCDTCRDDATITARVKRVSRAPELMCEGASSLIAGAVGGADIPESIPPALRCGDAITAQMDNATRSWGARAAAFLLDPSKETQDELQGGVASREVDVALLRELLLKPAGRGDTKLQDASMAANLPSVIQAIDTVTANRIAALDWLETTIQALQPAADGGSCGGACELGVSMACWGESTIEVPMSTGGGGRLRAIALAGFSPSTAAPVATYIATLPTSGVLYRPDGSGVWIEYAAGEEVPAPYVVAFEPRPNRRGLPYDSFTFNLTAGGNSTVGVVHFNVRCAPGYTVEDEGTCAPCPAGYPNQPGVTDQPVGSCTPCPPGTFNSETGATECTPCPSGEFQPEEGQSFCASCPPNSVTDPGATTADGCVCKKGYYGDPNNPPPGRTDGCIRCRDLAWALEPENQGKLPVCVCDTVGQAAPFPLAGWWVNPTDLEDIQKCRPEEACVGWSSTDLVLEGRCGPSYEDQRYTGEICAKCADNFYREEGTSLCRACPDNPWISGLLIGALIVLGGPFLLKMVKLQRGFGAINIALSFAQLVSLFQRFDWKWPDEIKAWMAWLGILINFFD